MNYLQAREILNSQRFIDAVLAYRRDPIGVSDLIHRRAELWITAEHVLSQA
jgi:hypothetical protein